MFYSSSYNTYFHIYQCVHIHVVTSIVCFQVSTLEKNDNGALQLRVHFDIGLTHQDPHRLWYQYKYIVLFCFRCQKAVIEIEIETVQKECSRQSK